MKASAMETHVDRLPGQLDIMDVLSPRSIRVVAFDPSYTHWGMVAFDVDVASGRMTRVVETHVGRTAPMAKKKRIAKGKVVVRKTADHVGRARKLVVEGRAFVARHAPALVISEVSYSPKSAAAAFSYGICIGILAGLDVQLVQISQRETKGAVGDVEAEKRDVVRWAYDQFPDAGWTSKPDENKLGVRTLDGRWLIPESEHVADAIAVGQAGLAMPEAVVFLEALR